MDQNKSIEQNPSNINRDFENSITQQDQLQFAQQENHLISQSNEAIPRYLLNRSPQIIKDIHSIIESDSINEEEKKMKLKEIYNELKKKDLNELKKIINIEAFNVIQTYINDCCTEIEKILLDIIQLVAEKGNYEQQFPNLFFNLFQESGLLVKIEQIIKDKIDIEKIQLKYSVETEQLMRIYVQIMKKQQTDQQMINIYVKIINKNMNNLLNAINNLKVGDYSENKNEQDHEEKEMESQQSIQLIKVLPLIREKYLYDYNNWRTRIPNKIIQILNEKICQLIHLNCPLDINCQQCIIISQSSAIIILKSVVFQSISEVSNNNQKFRDLLQKDHNIILHLTSLIAQFASQSQVNKEVQSQEQFHQQLQKSSNSLPLITSYLNLLQMLINNNNKCKLATQNSNFLHSLLTLTNFKLNIHFNQELDRQTLAIRNISIECLLIIQGYIDKSVQSQLVSYGYTKVISISLSTAGGSGEEQGQQIRNGLYNIFDFLRALHEGENCFGNESFPPQHQLSKRCVEQIEEEGGSEEVEAQIINKTYIQYGLNIMNQAILTKGSILNIYFNNNNPRPWWYYWLF